MASKKLPSFQFYPGDWRKEPTLSRCTHAAKGVYMDMICLMHECDERGVLATAGKAWSDEEIALAIGGDQQRNLSCIQELVDKGVVSRSSTGAIYCRRMVRDEHKRRLCSEAGQKGGGNPTLKGHRKGGSKGDDKGELKASSSSSSSSSSSEETPKPPSGAFDSAAAEYTLDFEAFWRLYPARKEKKFKAFATWKRILKGGADPATIMEAVRAFAASPLGRSKYCPGPEPWLNARRWEDDRAAWAIGDVGSTTSATSISEKNRRTFEAARQFLEGGNGDEG